MQYFKNITSLDDLKSQFRKLAFKHHPDVGGDIEAMKTVNNEYDILFPIWQHTHNTTSTVKNAETAAETRSEFYTQNGWKGTNYNINLGTKEIAVLIREYAKEAFPLHKFSVIFRSFAGGSEITIALMEAPYQVFKDGKAPKDGYIQNAEFYFKVNRTPNDPHPYELTEQAIEVLKDVKHFMDSYNREDCDDMIDYFNVHFYDGLEIGKWNKPFIMVEKTLRIKEPEQKQIKNNRLTA
jgi:hypothetical protein